MGLGMFLAIVIFILSDPKAMKNTIEVERARKDLTQEKLADMIGVSRQTINSIE